MNFCELARSMESNSTEPIEIDSTESNVLNAEDLVVDPKIRDQRISEIYKNCELPDITQKKEKINELCRTYGGNLAKLFKQFLNELTTSEFFVNRSITVREELTEYIKHIISPGYEINEELTEKLKNAIEYYSSQSYFISKSAIQYILSLIVAGANLNKIMIYDQSHGREMPLFNWFLYRYIRCSNESDQSDADWFTWSKYYAYQLKNFIIPCMLIYGADVSHNLNGEDGVEAPLLMMGRNNCFSLELIRLLVIFGANVNAVDSLGNDILCLLDKAIDEQTFKLFLGYGYNWTGLTQNGERFVLRSPSIETVELLQNHGLNINAREPGSLYTILLWSVQYKNVELIHYLLKIGAIDRPAIGGMTAYKYAHMYPEILEIFKQYEPYKSMKEKWAFKT